MLKINENNQFCEVKCLKENIINVASQKGVNNSICCTGEDIVHGLSWASVADRVVTRSEKQCRTKWLNYMNWKLKGGKDWTREDDMNLIARYGNFTICSIIFVSIK